jgi:hypothetical protein
MKRVGYWRKSRWLAWQPLGGQPEIAILISQSPCSAAPPAAFTPLLSFRVPKPVLEDHSRLGTIVNQTLVEGSSVPLNHGDEIVFGQPGDGWRVRFRVPRDSGSYTAPADPLELLVVSEVPRQIRIGRQMLEEHLGDRAFFLLKFLSGHKGNWYTTESLIELLWPVPDTAPLLANEALSRHKLAINNLIGPYIDGQDAIESWPRRGYRMKPRLEE